MNNDETEAETKVADAMDLVIDAMTDAIPGRLFDEERSQAHDKMREAWHWFKAGSNKLHASRASWPR